MKPKRPRDTNQLAKLIVDLSTGEAEEAATDAGKNAVAVERGRRGGQKGGSARAAALSPRKRSAIARKAAAARWSDRKKEL
jgi:hypothetical protein